MRGTARIRRRTQRLEATCQRAAVFALAQRLAPKLGITTEELLTEVAGLQRRMLAAGASTRDLQLAFVATELAIPAAELRAELARIRADA